MMNNTMMNNMVREFVATNSTLQEALHAVEEYTKEEIRDYITNQLYEYDMVSLIQEFNGELHQMEDLDDTFSYMTVTEVLESLQDIDLSDDYFNADTCRSGCDAWEVADVDPERVVEYIFDGECDWDDAEIRNMMREHERLVARVTDEFKMYERAKALFDMAMARDPKEVLSLLWNMNQQ